MFCGLKKLESLPDISKWNMKNCRSLGGMFQGCEKLKSLSEIGNWDTSKVESMISLFGGMANLTNLPLIDKFQYRCSMRIFLDKYAN